MDTTITVAGLDTPVGPLTVTATEAGVARISWSGGPEPAAADRQGIATDAVTQLAEYFRGERTRFALPIDLGRATAVQRAVLTTLYDTVAFGDAVTYGELAERSGTGAGARAIGGIMGSNPVPLVVPCHRVMAHDGLGGYSGGTGADGLEVKRWLLTFEGVLPPTLDWSPDHV